jgi:molybdenum cofactor synthesis domain-containing protein
VDERLRFVEVLERAIRREAAFVRTPFLQLLKPAHPFLYSPKVEGATILTIGSELVSGDVVDTNGAWLAGRLEGLGVAVRLIAAVPDDVEFIAAFIQEQAPRVDFLLVTGGLGGTPDDVTREAIAAAFGVERVELPDLAAALRARFARNPEYAASWALLPAGSRPLENPLGGAPGFVVQNVYVLPGLPAEMEAMFGVVAEELRRGGPIGSWRRRYRTRESEIAGVLAELCQRHPTVLVGSYPTFHADGSTVEIVVKSGDPAALAAATAWVEAALDDVVDQRRRPS